MEPPTDLGADSVRDEKVKVLRSLRPLGGPAQIGQSVVRGQYTAGAINGQPVVGYKEEQNVKPDSKTDTYVAMRVLLDNWRWSGVPIYIRVGKRLPKSSAEIAIQFKDAPSILFNKENGDASANVLVIRIQPDEGVSLRIQSKLPGASLRVEPVKMDFQYGASFGKASPEAYERLLHDAMSGDPTLFARARRGGAGGGNLSTPSNPPGTPAMARHRACTITPAGSWGPKEADELIERDGRSWRRL